MVAYQYDAFGNQSTVTTRSDANTTRVTSYTYDKNNRVTKITYPYNSTEGDLLWSEFFQYDIAGRLVAKLAGLVNAEGEITCGKVTAYAYDAWGRLEKVKYDYLSGESNPRWPLDVPVSIVSGDVTYTYELPDGHTDVGSRLRASMSDSSGTSEYTYDLLGRQKTYKPPVGLDPGFFVEYDYNSAGQKTRIKITNGTTTSYDVTYGYFANGWLKEVKYNGDMVASYEYDAVGNRLTQSNGNGTSTEYAYDTSDSRHFVNSITHKRGSTVLAAIDYTRDDSGNPLTMTDSIGTWNYGYDANNRLVGAVPPNPVPEQPAGGPYEYDWVGNRVRPPRDPNPPSTTNQMVYNKADQLVIWPGMHTYTYYGDGSLQYEKNTDGTTTLKSYTYTPDGLLHTATFDGKTLANAWDADENRVGFTVNSTNHTFVYDISAGIPAVIQEDGIYYIREPAGELIARLDGPNMNHYHFDQLGSTRLLTSSAGAITDEYSYDAYGAVLSHNRRTGSVDQPYQYVGQLGYYTHYQEPGFGLLQLGVRFYDAEVGRFTQRDQVSNALEGSYLYSSARPLVIADPSGRVPVLLLTKWGWRIGMGCISIYSWYHCSRCIDRATDYTRRMYRHSCQGKTLDQCLDFTDWFQAVKPGQECAEICGIALGTSAAVAPKMVWEFLLWLLKQKAKPW